MNRLSLDSGQSQTTDSSRGISWRATFIIAAITLGALGLFLLRPYVIYVMGEADANRKTDTAYGQSPSPRKVAEKDREDEKSSATALSSAGKTDEPAKEKPQIWPERTGVEAPTGFGALQLGMARNDLRQRIQAWGTTRVHSNRALGGSLLSLPNHSPYLGIQGCQVVFNDGKGLEHPQGEAKLVEIHLEFKEQARKELESFLQALIGKYGAPRHRGDSLFNPFEGGFELGKSGRLLHGENSIVWDWDTADVRLTLRAHMYEGTFTPTLIFEYGALSRERAEAKAQEEARRQAEEEVRKRTTDATASILEERTEMSSLLQKAEIRLVRTEVAVASVVYAMGGRHHKGHPWGEMRGAVATSISDLPDGVLFQIVIDERWIADGSLLRASEETRQQAQTFLRSAERSARTEHSVNKAAYLQPEIIFVVTNERDVAGPDWLEGARRRMGDMTKAHVLCWSFPGDFGYGGWGVTESPERWQDFASATGGSFTWVEPTSEEYFWGRGPEVEYALYNGYYQTGTIFYADTEEICVLKHRYGQFDSPFMKFSKDPEHSSQFPELRYLQVSAPVSPERVPEPCRKYFPRGSFVGDDFLQKHVTLTRMGSDRCVLQFTMPGAPLLIKEDLWLKQGETYHMYAPQRIPSLMVGTLAGHELRLWNFPDSNPIFKGEDRKFFIHLKNRPQARLVFYTGGGMIHEAVPEGKYEIMIEKKLGMPPGR